mgnify:CR=1 FL=1
MLQQVFVFDNFDVLEGGSGTDWMPGIGVAVIELGIADDLLQGEIAMARGIPNTAATYFRSAVASQDTLPYMEPPFWYYPTRQSLGEALLAAQRYDEAEAVYRRDLVDYPHNGWSMHGLMSALDAQGKTEEAAEMMIAISNHLGFKMAGKIDIYATEPDAPPKEKPYGYDLKFTPYEGTSPTVQ